MPTDQEDDFLMGRADEGAQKSRSLSAERNLDEELTPAPSQASPVRLALYAGFALFPVLPAILVVVAFFGAEGDFATGLFSVALLVLAAVTGALGLLVLAVAGFLVLAYRNDTDSENEVFGSAVPYFDRDPNEASRSANLDLRLAWGPPLLYLIFFAGAQFARPLVVTTPNPDATLVEIVGGILNVLALALFLYFWITGYVRLNRTGVPISRNFFVMLLVALAAFFVPVLLI